MKTRFALAIIFALGLVESGWAQDGGDPRIILRRGDVNNDFLVDHSDPIFLSAYLHRNGKAPPCMNQADVDDNGEINPADTTYLFNWLYEGGPPPPAPGPYATECSFLAKDAVQFGCEEPNDICTES